MVFYKAELPSKTKEEIDYILAQFVILENNCCLLVYTLKYHPDTRYASKHAPALHMAHTGSHVKSTSVTEGREIGAP